MLHFYRSQNKTDIAKSTPKLRDNYDINPSKRPKIKCSVTQQRMRRLELNRWLNAIEVNFPEFREFAGEEDKVGVVHLEAEDNDLQGGTVGAHHVRAPLGRLKTRAGILEGLCLNLGLEIIYNSVCPYFTVCL